MPGADAAAKIIGLKDQFAKAQSFRAQSEANINLAKSQLAQIDSRMKELGINPEQAEAELVALEEGLQGQIDTLAKGLSAEITVYNSIIAISNKALGR